MRIIIVLAYLVVILGAGMPTLSFAVSDGVQGSSRSNAAPGSALTDSAPGGGSGVVDCSVEGAPCLTNPLDSSISTIPEFFLAIINILMIFAVPFIVFFIIYAGFLYVSARGNAETIKKAHAALLYALIGGLLILGSRTILTIITETAKQIT